MPVRVTSHAVYFTIRSDEDNYGGARAESCCQDGWWFAVLMEGARAVALERKATGDSWLNSPEGVWVVKPVWYVHEPARPASEPTHYERNQSQRLHHRRLPGVVGTYDDRKFAKRDDMVVESPEVLQAKLIKHAAQHGVRRVLWSTPTQLIHDASNS
jgi:hypothetical protein